MIEAIDEHAVGLVGRVNGRFVRASAEQGERDTNHDTLLVGAGTHFDHIISGGVIDCRLDTGITPAGAAGVDAESGGNSWERECCREREKSQTSG